MFRSKIAPEGWAGIVLLLLVKFLRSKVNDKMLNKFPERKEKLPKRNKNQTLHFSFTSSNARRKWSNVQRIWRENRYKL